MSSSAAVRLAVLLLGLTFVFSLIPLSPKDRLLFFGGRDVVHGGNPSGFLSIVESAVSKKNVTVIRAGRLDLVEVDKFFSLYSLYNAVEPTVVIIMLAGDISSTRTVDEHFLLPQLEEFLAKVLSTNKPPVRVALVSPVLLGEAVHDHLAPQELEIYSKLLSQLSLSMGLEYFDVRSPLLKYLEYENLENRERGVLTFEGTTLNKLGSCVLARVFLALLDSSTYFPTEMCSISQMAPNIDGWTLDADRQFRIAKSKKEQEVQVTS